MIRNRRSGWRQPITLVLSALLAGTLVPPAGADAASAVPTVEHVGSFFVDDNLRTDEPIATPTSAEIVDLTADGETLVYTDSLTGRLGFVDVSDPAAPIASGAIDLPGGPTSVAIHKGWALVAVVTNVDPDGDGPLKRVR